MRHLDGVRNTQASVALIYSVELGEKRTHQSWKIYALHLAIKWRNENSILFISFSINILKRSTNRLTPLIISPFLLHHRWCRAVPHFISDLAHIRAPRNSLFLIRRSTARAPGRSVHVATQRYRACSIDHIVSNFPSQCDSCENRVTIHYRVSPRFPCSHEIVNWNLGEETHNHGQQQAHSSHHCQRKRKSLLSHQRCSQIVDYDSW